MKKTSLAFLYLPIFVLACLTSAYEKISGREPVEVGTNDTMSAEESFELQSVRCIENIEMQVAIMAMEKALKFVLEYHEGKQRLYNTPVSGKGRPRLACVFHLFDRSLIYLRFSMDNLHHLVPEIPKFG